MAFILWDIVLLINLLSLFGTGCPLISLCSPHSYVLVSPDCLVGSTSQLTLTHIHLTVVHTVKLTFLPLILLLSFNPSIRPVLNTDSQICARTTTLSYIFPLFLMHPAFSLFPFFRSTQPCPTTTWEVVCLNIIAICWMCFYPNNIVGYVHECRQL